MHAHVDGLAHKANVLLKHDELCLCKHAQGTDRGTRVEDCLWIPGVLPCNTDLFFSAAHPSVARPLSSRPTDMFELVLLSLTR